MTAAKKSPDRPKSREPRTVDSITELAEWAGVSRQTVHTWSRDPEFPVAENGGFSPFAVGAWHAMRALKLEEDFGEGNVDSPALERFRDERAKITKIQRLELEGSLLRLDFVREVFSLVSSQMRQLGERLNLNPANAALLLEDTLNEIERLGSKWIAEHLPKATGE